MKIYNQDKTEILVSPDLTKGHLIEDALIVPHEGTPEKTVKTARQVADELIAAGKEIVEIEGRLYSVEATYANGGRDVKEVCPATEPAVEAWDEYEPILIYVPYTAGELTALEIDELQAQLAETNDAAIMYSTGELTDEEWAPIAARRKELRERIAALRKSLTEGVV